MNIEKIANKLRPLMPNKVAHWMKTRELADPDLQALIEKQVISAAYNYLGDFHNKILLSLPSEKKAKGAINLGTILYDKEKYPFGISTSELLQNMAVLGRSGAGKTNVTFHILAQLIGRKIPFVFLDWKRTVRHLIPNFKDKLNIYTPGRSLLRFPFNPFVVPPGVESNVYVNQVVDVMSDAFNLGEGSRSIIRKAIATLYQQGNLCPTPKEIIFEVEKLSAKDRMRGWKITAMRALESLEFSDISSKDRISQEQLASKLLHVKGGAKPRRVCRRKEPAALPDNFCENGRFSLLRKQRMRRSFSAERKGSVQGHGRMGTNQTTSFERRN